MQNQSSEVDGFAMAVAVEAALVLIALAVAWLFGIALREQFPQDGQAWMSAVTRGLAAAAPMLAMFFWLTNSERRVFRELREQVQWILRQMFPSPSVGQLVMAATLAGVGEELLFRGVLQTLLVDWTNPVAGILVASLLFGALHALSKVYFAFATAVGLFLGWLAWEYHDLCAPMIAHAVYDFVALLYLGRAAFNDRDRI